MPTIMTYDIFGLTYEFIELKHEDFYNNLGEKDNAKQLDDEVNLGRHLGVKQQILINKELSDEQKVQTLIHEVTHAIMYALGLQGVKFNEEFICTFIGVHYNLINDIVIKWNNMF